MHFYVVNCSLTINAGLGKVKRICGIMGYGVMSTPGAVIDGKPMHAGEVLRWAKVGQDLGAKSAQRFCLARSMPHWVLLRAYQP